MYNLKKYQRKISNEEINTLPIKTWTGPVRIITTEKESQKVCTDIGNSNLLGFDTETRPTFKKGRSNKPAILQLCDAKCAYLFQLKGMGLGPSLKNILANPNIMKTGVACDDDIKNLQKLSPFKPANFFDLGKYAAKLELETHGLRNLTAKFLGFRLSKAARCSNWENKKLTKKQIIYAATDAYVGLQIYLEMKKQSLIQDKTEYRLAGEKTF